MKTDTLKQYITLRTSLEQERTGLKTRLQAIEAALGVEVQAPEEPGVKPKRTLSAAHKAALLAGRKANRTQIKGKAEPQTKRIQNPMSLRKAIIQVTTPKALTKQEILQAVQKVGYQFGGTDPMNSIQVVLYGQKFARKDGKFSPPVEMGTTVSKPGKAAISVKTGVKAKAPETIATKVISKLGVKPKRKVSAASRKKMKDAAKAYWAKVKAGK